MRITLTTAIFCCVTSVAHGITIQLDYRHDSFFGGNATAKAAVEAAAADISSVITTSLAAIPTDSFTGWNQQTSATFNWAYHYKNPATGADQQVSLATIAADTVTLFVGAQNILTGGTLGVGGPAGIGFSLHGSGLPPQWIGAVDQAESLSEVAYTRNGGPVIGNISGTTDFGSYTANYSVDYAPAYGNLWFDLDRNNDNVQDSAASLANYWQFDHTIPVAAGKNDMYSIALHEILHAIGVGSADSWYDLVSGTSWTGSDVQAITGTGSNLITADGNHIASGRMSTRITDGAPQEVVMDPSLNTGRRKSLTMLDLAFLRDIGWDTITPPRLSLAGDYNGDDLVSAADFTVWRDWLGQSANLAADGNGNNTIDPNDYAVWKNNYGMSTGAGAFSTIVPEPSACGLLGIGYWLWLLAIGRRCTASPVISICQRTTRGARIQGPGFEP